MAPRWMNEQEVELSVAEADAREHDRLAILGDRLPFSPRNHFPSDPSQLGWPATLCIELALGCGSVQAICQAHHIEQAEWVALTKNPAFVAELKATHERLRKDGAGFKARAGLQATEMLKTAWALVHDRSVPASVRADLIGKVVKWAGLDASKDQAAAKGAVGFNIVLNLA